MLNKLRSFGQFVRILILYRSHCSHWHFQSVVSVESTQWLASGACLLLRRRRRSCPELMRGPPPSWTLLRPSGPATYSLYRTTWVWSEYMERKRRAPHLVDYLILLPVTGAQTRRYAFTCGRTRAPPSTATYDSYLELVIHIC